MPQRLTIGSRASKLALTQSRWVADQLRRFHPGLVVDIVEIATTGDIKQNASLTEIGGKGAFTKELEDALLGGRCDIAVHSLKDLPTVLPDGLRILCTPVREDTADVLLLRENLTPPRAMPLGFIPEGMTIGTSSLRRVAQLGHLRPDLSCLEFRGNVDTRLRKLQDGVAYGCILAAAGLKRLALLDEVEMRVGELHAHWLRPPQWLPAVGQGALGIEGRESDADTASLLAPLHDAGTFAATSAERAFLNRLGAGCQAPVGALATVPEGSLVSLTGRVLSKDGAEAIEYSATGGMGEAERLGIEVAENCLANGGDKLM